MFRRDSGSKFQVQGCQPAGRVQADNPPIPRRDAINRISTTPGDRATIGKKKKTTCCALRPPPSATDPSTSLRYARGPGAHREKKKNDVLCPLPSALRRSEAVPSPLPLRSFFAPSPFSKGADRGMTEERPRNDRTKSEGRAKEDRTESEGQAKAKRRGKLLLSEQNV
jgi:hypothetical protein